MVIELLAKSAKEEKTTLRKAVGHNYCIGGSQGYQRCRSKTECTNNRRAFQGAKLILLEVLF